MAHIRSTEMSQIDGLWRRGKEFLGSELPVIAGAMTWISDAPFVAAVSNAGAFGCLADEILRTRDLTDRPFAVNLITIAPNYRAHLDAVAKSRVPFIVFAGSFPRKPEILKAKESGAKVLAFAPTESLARHLIGSGVDALILEGSEAGGHIGHVSLGILLQQVLLRIDEVPIFVAGGIADGAYVAHLLLMGAAGVQLGTYFVLTEECGVHPRFKAAFIKAQARDAVATPQVGSELKVVAVRALRNRGLEGFLDLQVSLVGRRKRKEISHEEAQHEVESYWVGALRRAVKDGDVETGSLMAGQSVGLVDRVRPLREALSVLVADAEAELVRVLRRLEAR
jgi:enoyl-[acyl-carrier protein] reductase II